MKKDIIDKTGLFVFFGSWIFCWMYYRNYSNESVYSFIAAFLTAIFIWVGYIALRLIILALWR